MRKYDIARCKRALIENGLEQKDLAREGLSESVISKFFRGENVFNSTAARIIEQLGLRVKDVLLLDDELVGSGTTGSGTKRRRV